MKITESRLKEIIREELSEQRYTSKIASFLKSLRRPGDAGRRQRAQQRLQAAEPEEETPSRVDLLKPPPSTREIQGSKNYKKFMASLLDFFANQMQIDIKIAKKIVRDIRAKTPASGEFNKLVFKEQIENEIDIAAILANSGLGDLQQIKVLGALKKWAAQNSDLIDNKMTTILKLRDKEAQKAAPDPTPEPAPEPQAVDVTNLLNAKTLEQYIDEYNKLAKASDRELRPIDMDAVVLVRTMDHRRNSTDEIIDFLRSRIGFSAFGDKGTLKKFVELSIVPEPSSGWLTVPAVEDEDEEETEQIKPVPPADDEEKEKKKKSTFKKFKNRDLDPSTDEGIDRKDQVIIERWQVIAGIDKKVL